MKGVWLFLFLAFGLVAVAQKPLATTPYRQDSFNVKRARAVVGLQAGIATSSAVGLYYLWYSGYERSGFHWINDNQGWHQIDKFGHTIANYHMYAFCYNLNRWSGMEKKNALIWGAGISYGFQLAVEYFDGLSDAWGASVGDLAANTLGMGSFLAQEMVWNEQKIIWKFSFHKNDYSGFDDHVQLRAEKLFGTATYQTFLKDYNAQTHWLSINPRSFTQRATWMPDWLNIAFGYSAEGMFGANKNAWIEDDCCSLNYDHIPRYRQHYFSLDVDWERIETTSKFLKFMAPYLNMIKTPLPALEYSRVNGLVLKPFYF